MERSVGSSSGCQSLHADERQHEDVTGGGGKEGLQYAAGDASRAPMGEELSEGIGDPTNVLVTPKDNVELEVRGESRLFLRREDV